jgi:hypothetical protein
MTTLELERAELLPARETLAFLNFTNITAIQLNINVNVFSIQGVNNQSNNLVVLQGFRPPTMSPW